MVIECPNLIPPIVEPYNTGSRFAKEIYLQYPDIDLECDLNSVELQLNETITLNDVEHFSSNRRTEKTIGPIVWFLLLEDFQNFLPVETDIQPSCQSILSEINASVASENFGGTVSNFLSDAGFPPDRKGTTTDGSELLEYFKRGQKRIVDVYPDGEVIVILSNRGVDEVYEFSVVELNQIVDLLKHDERPV